MFFSHSNQRPTEPWEPDTYQTGCTRPPKSHGGPVAMLLAALIFLAGIVSFLGILNVRLFQRLNDRQKDPDSLSVLGSAGTASSDPEATVPSAADSTDTLPQEASIQLEQPPQPVENVPQEGGLSLQQIYEKAIDSVVSISCTTGSGSASGTGVVLTKNGYLVTNAHVVENASAIRVHTTDGRTFSARLVGADTASDLAVLYVQAKDLAAAEFGSSDSLRVGDAVAAIGDPLGSELRGTMTDGIVSAINRNITTGGRTMTLIQTNAALNSGNSGGPLLNCYGQVIGINTMKIASDLHTGSTEGLGFAIPSTTVKQVVDQLIRQGYVSGRPSLGVQSESVSQFYQYYYRLPAGMLVTDVEESAVAAEGLQEGDILLTLDGVRVTDADTLDRVLSGFDVGQQVDATVYRNGKNHSVTLTIRENTR